MTRQLSVLSGVALCVTAHASLAAQTVFASRTMLESNSAAGCATAMSSEFSASGPLGRIGVAATPVRDGDRWKDPTPSLSLETQTPTIRGWRVRAAGALASTSSRCVSPSQWSRSWLQLARAIPNGGVAVSWANRSLSSVDPSRDRQGLTMSVWQYRGPNRMQVDLRSRPQRWTTRDYFNRLVQRPDSARSDTTPGGWVRYTRNSYVPDSSESQQRAESVELRTSWQRRFGRATLDIAAGGIAHMFPARSAMAAESLTVSTAPSLPTRAQLWSRVDVAFNMTSSATALLSVAALPSPRTPGGRATRMVSAGLTLATPNFRRNRNKSADNAAVFEMRRVLPASVTAPGDSVLIRVRLRDSAARQIEISGEPFRWKPVSMQRVDNEYWEVLVLAKPGTYRISVRVDGTRWTAPPGWPSIHDEFGGEVALVPIR